MCDAILFAALPGYSNLIQDAAFILDAHAPLPRIASARTETQVQKFKKQLQNPFFACTTESWMDSTPPKHKPVHNFNAHLLLPHFVAEYKKYSDSEGKALNQGRMYLVSVVTFYSALGIEDYPFFALVTAGKLGAILMAWKSSKHEVSCPRRYHKCADAFTENISDRTQCQEIRYFVPDTGVSFCDIPSTTS
jgi:hypothetical protein